MKDVLKVLNEVRSLVKEADQKVRPLTEQILPVAARQLQELAERVTRAWNRAYGEFAEARALAYDIAATFGLSTRVSSGPKEVKNITRDSEESLVSTISWIADRFKSDYQKEVVRRGADIRASARRVMEAAERAESLEDDDLRSAAAAFIKDFLPFRTAVSDHLYRPVGGIVRRAEEIVNRYLPPERRPERPPSGKRGTIYKGTPLTSPADVADAARQVIERLDTFTRLSEPTIGEIERIASLAAEVAAEHPPSPPPSEPGPEEHPLTLEANREREIYKRKRISEWLSLSWEADAEIGAFI
jgi:hypothetical protein